MNLELIKQIEDNRIRLFSLWERTGEVVKCDIENTYGFISKYPSPRLNRVFRIIDNHNTLPETVKTIKEYYSKDALSFLVHCGPTTMPGNIEKILLDANFNMIGSEVGMARSLDDFNEKFDIPDDLYVREVRDLETLKDWCYVFGTSFGAMKYEIEQQFILESKLGVSEKLTRTHYICYQNSTPVGCSTLNCGNNEAGIYCIGTLRQYRGKGIGRIMTLKPLLDAKNKRFKTAVLHASELGYPIYEKLGFKDCCRLYRFLYKNN